MDPYGIDPALPEELRQVGREYFVKAFPAETWVWFGDLPDELENKLWAKHKHELAFPAGLAPRDVSGYKNWKFNDSNRFDGADAAALAKS